MTNCNKCGQTITFDNESRSPNGKLIPLNVNGSKHDCEGRFNGNGKTKAAQKSMPEQLKISDLPDSYEVQEYVRLWDIAKKLQQILYKDTQNKDACTMGLVNSLIALRNGRDKA